MRWLIGVLAGVLMAGPAAAAIPDASWKGFVEETLARYGEPDPSDFEDQLYAAARHNKSQAKAIAEFGRTAKLDPATAEAYATVIVDTVVYFERCEQDCPFAPGVAVYDEAAKTGDASGRLLTVVGRYVKDDHVADFVRLAWDHPAAARIFLALYGYGSSNAYLGAAVLRLPADPVDVPVPLLGEPYDGTADELSGAMPAILEAAEARLGDSPAALAWRAALAQQAVEQELWLGLDEHAVARYLAYPQAVRELMPYAPAALTGSARCRQADVSFAFADRLAAALWTQGRKDEALAMLNRTWPQGWRAGSDDALGRAMLRDAITPSLADNDLYAPYIKGQAMRASGRPECSDGQANRSRRDESGGWLFTAGRETPAVRQIVAGRLEAAGYGDMATWLRGQTHGDNTYVPAVWPKLADLLPAGIAARQADWAGRIDAARKIQVEQGMAMGPIHVVTTALKTMWTEKPLPDGVKAWGEDEESPALAKGLDLPVPAEAVVRYEAQGTDAAAVYLSSDYDLPGEVPAYGLWLALKRGGAWQRPLYLGLQHYFPYVATEGSRLPLIAGDRLNLEVRIQEIDPDTVTFPPVALGYKREAGGLYLDIALADLARDSDSDGLSDIEEARLGLKPDAADSDGDGMADGDDALPLTAYAPASPAEGAVARAILEAVAGHDAGAIVMTPRKAGDDPLAINLGGRAPGGKRQTVFLVSDRDVFAGIADAPFRLIVYSTGDLEKLGRLKTPFYPPQIVQLFHSLDGKDWYVNWSASWVGGSFSLHCEGETCTREDMGGWIT